MKKFYWLGILSLSILAAGSAQAESPTLQGSAMLSCSGLPCTDIELKDGKHLRMLIELGDANTIVDSTVAKNLGLSVRPASAADTAENGNSDLGSSVLEGAHLGNASLGDLQVQVADLNSKIQKNQMPQADGVLGYNAFRDRLVQVDYKHQTLRVSEPLASEVKRGGFCGDISMVDFSKNDPPVLVTTGFAVDGKPIAAKIDTLYTGTMLIYPASIAKLNLQTQSGVNATQFFRYVDGGVAMREGKAKTESFGSKAIAHNVALFFAVPPMRVPDGTLDGTVGAGLLTGHVLYIDLHSKHFWMTS